MSKREETGGKMRTKPRHKDTPKEQGFSYRKHILTTSLYCVCHDCIKYCNYRKPVQCIDPFLMDMKHTYWIYHGLVTASKTERAICIATPDNNQNKPEENEENATRN